MLQPLFEADVLRRYDQSGPRYTSYPTAPQFHDGFGETDLREHARRSNADLIPRSLSLYVHVPFCFSPCFYCGCNRIVTRDAARGALYLERLLCEIELTAPLFDIDRDVVQLHFGGGTPNFLSPQQLARIVDRLDARFHFSGAKERDFSIELDPRSIACDEVAALVNLGLNRASLGVQDFDPAVQSAVNRVQSEAHTLALIEACRRAGMRSINVDLIYGLPMQTRAGFARTLASVLSARPDRIAVYGYAHLPNLFRAQTQIDADDLPSVDEKLGLLQMAIDTLTAAGYQYIGMDHFALPDDELSLAQERGALHRNFMGYTTHADCDLVGLGVSAISHIGDSFSQSPRDLPSWEMAIDAGRLPVWRGVSLGDDDVLRGVVIQSLMCHGQIDISAIEHRYGIDFSTYFASALEQLRALQADGLATVSSTHIVATPIGRLLLRRIAMCFDAYLDSATRKPVQQYSRVI